MSYGYYSRSRPSTKWNRQMTNTFELSVTWDITESSSQTSTGSLERYINVRAKESRWLKTMKKYLVPMLNTSSWVRQKTSSSEKRRWIVDPDGTHNTEQLWRCLCLRFRSRRAPINLRRCPNLIQALPSETGTYYSNVSSNCWLSFTFLKNLL